MSKNIDSKAMFATMNPWKLFFTVAMPGMISMFAMSIYSIIEGVFLGQKLGEAALAAVNIAIPVVMINFSLSDLIGVGASVPISISLGKKDEDTANNIFTCSVVMIFIAALTMGSIMFFAAEPLARFMGAEGDVVRTSVKYIRTFAVCSPISTLFFSMDNYLRISGYIKLSMYINIFSNVVTVVLLVLFLIVLEMDVSGSALAACLSMCLCSVVALLPFLRGETLLKFVKPRFSFKMFKQIALCGSPVFLSNISGRVTSIMMNITLMTMGTRFLGAGGGTTAVAAYAVLMYAGDMFQPLVYGMSDSVSPAIGFNWGARNFKRVRQLLTCNCIGGLAVSLVSAVVVFFMPRTLAALFVDSGDAALLELSVGALKLFCTGYFFRWFIVAAQSFLTAIEKPVHATIMSVSIAMVFPILCLKLLEPLGLEGIWLNTTATSILACALGAVLISNVFRRVKKESRGE